MRGRKYTKRIEIYQTPIEFDGVSGNIEGTPILVSKSWCNITSVDVSRNNLTTQYGLLDASKFVLVKMRKRNDLTYDLQTMYIVYRGDKYIIKSFPNNVNFEDSEIVMMCIKESSKANDNDLSVNLNV